MKAQRPVLTQCEACCRRRRCIVMPVGRWWTCRQCGLGIARRLLWLDSHVDWRDRGAR